MTNKLKCNLCPRKRNVDRINKLDKNEKTLEVLDKTITSLISLKL